MNARSTVRRAAARVGIVLAAAMACNGPPAAELPERERQALAAGAEAVVASLFAAINDHDAERALRHYEPGDELVHVACTLIRQGHEPLARVFRGWLQDVPEVAIQHEVVAARVLDRGSAVVTARGRREDGLSLFWTFVLRRDDRGDWRVVQEHQSWPDCREQRIHPVF